MQNDNNTTPKTKVVLAGIDGSSIATAVADYAAWIASRVHVPLKLLHTLESHFIYPTDLSGSIGLGTNEILLEELTELEAKRSKLLKEQGKELLAAAAKRAEKFSIAEPVLCQRHGSLTENLVDLEDDIRVLVLGVSGEEHSKEEGVVGNQVESVLRSLHRPILIVNRDFVAPERIMLAYDGSEAAQKALAWVESSPLYSAMHCHIVHVAKEGENPEGLLDEPVARVEKAGLKVTQAYLQGQAQEQILAYQQEHDVQMLVMGSFGHSRLRELLWGSFTLKMLQKASIPLLLLR